MASVATAAPAKPTPWWRGLNKLSQEQVVAAIVVSAADRRSQWRFPVLPRARNILGLVRSISILGILGSRHGADRHQPQHRS